MQALFISDLHLMPERPDITRAFQWFMTKWAPQAAQLYILGDLFEYWLGDDAMEAFHDSIVALLKQYTEAGHALFFMPGNRDFAIGQSFLSQSGARWLKDPTVVTLGNKPVLLAHGDRLCTNDWRYQCYRAAIRNPMVMGLLRLTPVNYRRQLGHYLRQRSRRAKAMTAAAVMDVTPASVQATLHKHRVQTLIHGHTHRPAVHTVSQAGQPIGLRYVLGDWDQHGWFIRTADDQLILDRFAIPPNK